jgi:transcriptional regulator with XRE-family HTH domain
MDNARTRRHLLPGELGAALRSARLRRGWSLRRAGREVGIDAGYLCLLEQGKRCPSSSVAFNLATTLKLDADVAQQLFDVARPDAGRDWRPPAA